MSVEQHFASDNNAGLCPEALSAFIEANSAGHVASYGDDAWTARACDLIRGLFDHDCAVYFVFNGTAANALALAHVVRPYQAVICHEAAHIATDECAAPEMAGGGMKLVTGGGAGAKLDPPTVTALATRRRDLHFPRAAALSITQSTEFGTVYRPAEIAALAQSAKSHDLVVHMDGARLANAVAHLGVTPADVTWRSGVDVLSFGSTKNGLAVGEAVVFFDKTLARDFDARAKQAGQLASKMRFVSAPWVGLLENGAWLAHARHANTMARRLADGLSSVQNVRLLHPVEANGVFVAIPPRVQERVRARGWRFHTFIGADGCRLMCAWDTTPATIDRFVADVRAAAS
jgi:threonine aldolase